MPDKNDLVKLPALVFTQPRPEKDLPKFPGKVLVAEETAVHITITLLPGAAKKQAYGTIIKNGPEGPPLSN